jgi:hypothetical protein
MTLDSRYRWFFPGRDVHGREATYAIGIDDGRVIVNVPPGWLRFADPKDPDDPVKAAEIAERAGYSLVTASYVARSASLEVGGSGGE